jgi:hypothetical protein
MNKPPVSYQAAANCDRFEALIVGATFCVHARHSWRLLERYAKIDGDRVQSITDGRIWPFAITEASGAGAILVPDGAYSVAPYDCDRNGGAK